MKKRGYKKRDIKRGFCKLQVFFLMIYQALILSTRKAPDRKAPIQTCSNTFQAGGIEDHCPEIGDLCPGVHAFPYNMKAGGCLLPAIGNNDPDGRKHGTKDTITVEKKCTRGLTLFHPKSRTPRNPDSRANAKMPSAARALPKISPTYFE